MNEGPEPDSTKGLSEGEEERTEEERTEVAADEERTEVAAEASDNDLDAMLAAAGLVSGSSDDAPVKSGFVSFVGRPNVGKSTLLNRILGQKVSIVSDKPQTTRHQIRGILDRPDAQIVFVDTPGIHKPRSLMGERLNETATSALGDIDVACLIIDGTAAIGSGDRFVASRLPRNSVLVLNKVDITKDEHILKQLSKAAEFAFAEYFPVSARTGKGVDALVEYLVDRMPEGPRWYPAGTVRDFSEQFWIAELVREQLLAVAREELPHSIATRVTEYDPPLVRVEIAVERESQKGMVIGKGGRVLKEAGIRARRQLPEGMYLELHVSVAKDWQSRSKSLEQFGY